MPPARFTCPHTRNAAVYILFSFNFRHSVCFQGDWEIIFFSLNIVNFISIHIFCAKSGTKSTHAQHENNHGKKEKQIEERFLIDIEIDWTPNECVFWYLRETDDTDFYSIIWWSKRSIEIICSLTNVHNVFRNRVKKRHVHMDRTREQIIKIAYTNRKWKWEEHNHSHNNNRLGLWIREREKWDRTSATQFQLLLAREIALLFRRKQLPGVCSQN